MKWQQKSLSYRWPQLELANLQWIRRLLPTPGNVIFTLVMITVLLWAQSAGAVPFRAESAASTGTIAYQGRLADSSGNPLTSTLSMSFRLYSAVTGGTPLWTEQWSGSNGVKVSDGLFNVMLGSLTPIPQSVITGNANLFLGITVGSDDEMTPRVQLGSVPFAVQALSVPDGSITAAKIADGAVTQAKLSPDIASIAKYEGFSYYTTGYTKPAHWNPLVMGILDFNTFGNATYNNSTGTFTAPKAGYYQFRSHGYIATANANGERIAVGIYINGGLRAFSGGQFSIGDTPGPQFAHVVHLEVGDTVTVYSYTPIEARYGGGGGHFWWFQGDYLGN